jgi:hypothetical protein
VLGLDAAINWMGYLTDMPSSDAVRVVVSDELTASTVAAKLTLGDPDEIVTDGGTVSEPLLLLSSTRVALVAAALKDTVQFCVAGPVIDWLSHETFVNVGVATAGG